MFFKNALAYKILDNFSIDAIQLEEKLAEHGFTPCGATDLETAGWVAPIGSALVHSANGALLICLREEKKLLPASVVREALDERIREVEDREMRKVRKREREQLKEEIIFELLPRAFTRSTNTYGYIDTQAGMVVVDASTWRKAEHFTERLRDALGSLPIAPPATENAPASVLSQWLLDAPPADIEIGDEAVLEDPSVEGCEIRCKRHDLDTDEITAHLKLGKRVRALRLNVADRATCLVGADYSIRRIRFSDIVQEREAEYETFEEQFDADFVLMVAELRQLIGRLLKEYGDLANSAAAA